MAHLMRLLPDREPTLADARRAIKEAIERHADYLAPSALSSTKLTSLMENAVRALSLEYTRLRLPRVTAIERRVERVLDHALPTLSGCPDLVHYGGIIVDWKTTWHPWRRDQHRFLIQHQVYPWLVGLSSASFNYVVAVLDEQGNAKASSYSEHVTQSDILKGLARARKALEFAISGEIPDPPKRPCQFCPFRDSGGCGAILASSAQLDALQTTQEPCKE